MVVYKFFVRSPVLGGRIGKTSAQNVKYPVSVSLGKYPMNYQPVCSKLVKLISILTACLSNIFFRMV